MKQAAYDDWNDSVYEKTLKLFGAEKEKTKEHGAFESFVFDSTNGKQNLIIKATHSSSRDKNILLGQIEWMDYLEKNDISVIKPTKSINGKYLETIKTNNNEFYVTCHIKAEGIPVKDAGLNDKIIHQIGEITGKMHEVTKDFKVKMDGAKLQHWHEDKEITNLSEFLPDDDFELKNKHAKMRDNLLKMPTNRDDYGFIHTDLHTDNLIINNEKITVIDFFDSMYYWFAYDIAVIFYYLGWFIKDMGNGKRFGYFKNFANHFVAGYNKHSKIKKEWVGTFNTFLKQRDVELLTVLYSQAGTKEFEKYKKYLVKLRENVLNDELPSGIDLDGIMSELL